MLPPTCFTKKCYGTTKRDCPVGWQHHISLGCWRIHAALSMCLHGLPLSTNMSIPSYGVAFLFLFVGLSWVSRPLGVKKYWKTSVTSQRCTSYAPPCISVIPNQCTISAKMGYAQTQTYAKVFTKKCYATIERGSLVGWKPTSHPATRGLMLLFPHVWAGCLFLLMWALLHTVWASSSFWVGCLGSQPLGLRSKKKRKNVTIQRSTSYVLPCIGVIPNQCTGWITKFSYAKKA